MAEAGTSLTTAKKVFVLCFDGTGNKFSGTDNDSNILKIYRLLDRSQGNQFHYYQPGIGTYVTTTSLEHTSVAARFKSWYDKAMDSAVGTSFASHVMAGYRFLMRYYSPEDDIYFFGFSRGAYTARFLAEMLDHVGLLSAGNEELQKFAWKAFSRWQGRRGGDSPEEREEELRMYTFMKNFRETFSRPVRRIRFLGLFDTVNSVPRFESAWMQRSRFPYTARSSAKVVRHAVAINERRAKFRQDLITGSKVTINDDYRPRMHRFKSDYPSKPARSVSRNDLRRERSGSRNGQKSHNEAKDYNFPEEPREPNSYNETNSYNEPKEQHSHSTLPIPVLNLPDADNDGDSTTNERHHEFQQFTDAPEHPTRLKTPPQSNQGRRSSYASPMMSPSLEELHQGYNQDAGQQNKPQVRRRYSDQAKEQDVLELWFPGGHADIGGGWPKAEKEKWALSHSPLVWMVHEAEKAGLAFDPEKMQALNCCPDKIDAYGNRDVAHEKNFRAALHQSSTEGLIHDCLQYGGGLPASSVFSWRIMEYLPFKRMDLQPNGSWTAIRWPLPAGETRDIPGDAKIHCSAINRMRQDPSYRPGNLILLGRGGRGRKRAPKHAGIGEWEVIMSEGDPVREAFVKKGELAKLLQDGEKEMAIA